MLKDISIAERQPIHVEDIPWTAFKTDNELVSINIGEGSFYRTLMDEEQSNSLFIHVKFDPDYYSPPHWHPSNTIYIVTKGVLYVEGEQPYREGDIRWVKGGRSYGAETAGKEGCEFYLASLGPFGTFPADNPHPIAET